MPAKRIYLAGPMTGLPEYNYPAFNAEAARLRAMGYHVENPAENPEQSSWEDYLRQAIRQMLTCDMVALLPGWEGSRGAGFERSVALQVGMALVMADQITEALPSAGVEDDIPCFDPGNGNKARRRAESLSICIPCGGVGTIGTGISEAPSTICNKCDGVGKVASPPNCSICDDTGNANHGWDKPPVGCPFCDSKMAQEQQQ